MKGMVFVEFLDMVEEKFSTRTLQKIIDAADLPSGGIYSSLGTYDHAEIVKLVTGLSAQTGLPVPELLKAFGGHLFNRLAQSYPIFFTGVTDAFAFVGMVDGYVHMEVRKLYPDAELPSFQCERPDANTLTLTYKSARAFADLAHGMLIGCIAHFGEAISLTREDGPGADGSSAVFVLRKA